MQRYPSRIQELNYGAGNGNLSKRNLWLCVYTMEQLHKLQQVFFSSSESSAAAAAASPVCLICCSTSLTLPPSQQESTTSPPNSLFLYLNVNAGTNSNCIQHQLIQFFKKSRRIQNPCRQMDWVTRLLCLVSLLLIFLLLLPFPLHCGV